MASPVRERRCCLCCVVCQSRDKTFNVVKNASLSSAFEDVVGAITDKDSSTTLCDACKRRILSANSGKSGKEKILKLITDGEVARGPADASFAEFAACL